MKTIKRLLGLKQLIQIKISIRDLALIRYYKDVREFSVMFCGAFAIVSQWVRV